MTTHVIHLLPRAVRRSNWRRTWPDFQGTPPSKKPRPSWWDSAAELLRQFGKKKENGDDD